MYSPFIAFVEDKDFIKNIDRDDNNCLNQELIRAYEQIKNRNSYNECRDCPISNVIQKINLYENIDY